MLVTPPTGNGMTLASGNLLAEREPFLRGPVAENEEGPKPWTVSCRACPDAAAAVLTTHVFVGICQVPEGGESFAVLTVKENLELGAYLRRDKEKMARDLERIYELFPILKERSRQQAGTLSGGEQRMLAISRGLMSDPKVILFDEPSLGLSPLLVQTIMETIVEIKTRRDMGVMLVEQNANIALQIADRGYVLELGRMALEGSGKRLLSDDAVPRAYLGI